MKLPAMQFYPGDWRKDPGVQSLGYFERGVWFEVLLLMHESEPRGKLLLNGNPMTYNALKTILGLPLDQTISTIETLIKTGICSVELHELPLKGSDKGNRWVGGGVLLCRRMLRDEEGRKQRAEDGKRGGNPALCENYNAPGFVYAIQRASDGAVKIGISVNPTKRLYKLRYENKTQSLEMLAFIRVDDMGKEEALLHDKYKHCASGEWFSMTAVEVSELIFTLKGSVNGKRKEKHPPSSSSSLSVTSSLLSGVIPAQLDTPEFRTAWERWKSYQKQCRKKLSPMTEESQLKELSAFGPVDAVAVLEKAISKGWRGYVLPEYKKDDPLNPTGFQRRNLTPEELTELSKKEEPKNGNGHSTIFD